MLNTIFLGNSDFAMPTLKVMYEKTNLKAVITGLDKTITKHGKSFINEPLPKIFAKEHNIPCFQPINLKDETLLNTLKNFNATLMVVISYGRLLPELLYSIPPLGTFNLHGSLLPLYRGASPLQESLIQGDTKTGITLQRIAKEIDTGDIFLQKEIPILHTDVYPVLRLKMAELAAVTLSEFLDYYENNNTLMPSIKQKDAAASYCEKIKKEAGNLNFKDFTANEIYNKYRAFYTWPQITINIKGIPVKISEMDVIFNNENLKPGTVLQADRNGFIIQTKKDALFIKTLKPQNKKEQDYTSFINGYGIKKGEILV